MTLEPVFTKTFRDIPIAIYYFVGRSNSSSLSWMRREQLERIFGASHLEEIVAKLRLVSDDAYGNEHIRRVRDADGKTVKLYSSRMVLDLCVLAEQKDYVFAFMNWLFDLRKKIEQEIEDIMSDRLYEKVLEKMDNSPTKLDP